MRRIILAAVSMFVVCGFLLSCSKEDRNKIINGGNQEQNVNTDTPNDTVSTEEKNKIENSDPLSSADYEIFELRFGSNFVSGSSQDFTIVNNANYSFVFGLKNKNTGDILYKAISAADWTFSSDNPAVTKNGNTGFNASNTFYCDNNASIYVNISWKELSKNFNFVLKSNKENPNGEVVAFRWVLQGSEPYVYTDGLTANQLNGAVLDTTFSPDDTRSYSVSATGLIGSPSINIFIKKDGVSYIIGGNDINYSYSAALDGSSVEVFGQRKTEVFPVNFTDVYYNYDVANVASKAPGKQLIITRTLTCKYDSNISRVSKVIVNYF